MRRPRARPGPPRRGVARDGSALGGSATVAGREIGGMVYVGVAPTVSGRGWGERVPRLHRPVAPRRPELAVGAARPDALLAGLLGDRPGPPGHLPRLAGRGTAGCRPRPRLHVPLLLRAGAALRHRGALSRGTSRDPGGGPSAEGPLPGERVRAALPRRVRRGRADQDRPPSRRSAGRRSRRLGGAALAQGRARVRGSGGASR